MSDNHQQRPSTDPMDKLIDDMAAELRNPEGQYIPMGFSTQKNLNWSPQPSASSYLNYPIHYQEPQHVEPVSSYIHENNAMFEPVMFQKNINFPDYNNDAYNGTSQPVFNNYQTPVMSDQILQENLTPNVPQTPIFTNWNLPNNTTGTYSPFGTSATFKPTLFEFQVENEENSLNDKTRFKIQQQSDFNKFNFNKDVRKSRPLAEVKPMRPSYSDVLTKPVPPANNLKSIKTEMKDIKFKNSSRKNGKLSKVGSVLNRTNTSNEIIKDLPHLASKSEKKPQKLHQGLNRKWNSLDNIAEPVFSAKGDEPKKIKKPDDSFAKTLNNKTKGKLGKNANLTEEILDDSIQAEPINSIKNVSKKNKSSTLRSKHDAHGSGSEKNSSKRLQRNRRKEEQPIIELINEKAKLYIKHWWKVITVFFTWLFNVVSDVCSLSVHLGGDFLVNASSQLISLWRSCISTTEIILKRFRLSAWILEKFETKFKEKPKKSKFEEETTNSFLQNGLENNISMPTTGEEAMKRLLACKGKDPYSILGVTPKCNDDDIKKYYKRQAFLVHPDKNNQPGAEEAFKILVHAFDMIGTPEHRTIYDRGVAESAFVVQNFSQMAELLQQLQQKMEMNANTIRCSVCNDRHKRIKIDRPSYAARNCKTCKIHHAAREGDIWAEAKCFGFLWHYYACMEGSVYDITDWAGCQKETLKHLKPDTHHVQYRIALGKQQTNNNNNVNNLPRRNSQIPKTEKPDLENLLNSLYGHDAGTTNKRKNKNRK